MDWKTWQARVHGVTKSRTRPKQLSTHAHVVWDQKASLELSTVPPARAQRQSGWGRAALGAAVWGLFQALTQHPWSEEVWLWDNPPVTAGQVEAPSASSCALARGEQHRSGRATFPRTSYLLFRRETGRPSGWLSCDVCLPVRVLAGLLSHTQPGNSCCQVWK